MLLFRFWQFAHQIARSDSAIVRRHLSRKKASTCPAVIGSERVARQSVGTGSGGSFGRALAMKIIIEVCMNRSRRSEWIKGALLYFAAVFGAGFMLGTVRVLLLVPRIGVRSAELLETPLMIIISVFAARWAVRRAGIQNSSRDRLSMGSLALIFMLAAELAMTAFLRNESIVDAIANRDPISGTAYLCALVLFGLMPWIAGGIQDTSEFAGSIEEFIPAPDISESHEILVRAPAEVVFDVAENLDIRS